MGLFGKRIDVKNAAKTTYSEDDLTKLDLNYQREFVVQTGSRIYTPFRKEIPRAWLTQIRDMAFEKILDDHLFTFQHLLVVPNPYGASVQTALLLFNTSKECSVRYRILGKTEGVDFVGETEKGTRHRVPILGLYKGYTNKLKLELLDEEGEVFKRRDLTIYCRDIPLKLQNIVTKTEHKEVSQFPFVLVNGVRFNPIALDQNGEVRYSLQIRTNRIGMLPLENGHFLFADTSVNQTNRKGEMESCQYHEMDYMGRIYRTYLLDYPIGNVAAQRGDSLYLLTSSGKGKKGDCIIQLNRGSGEVKKRCALGDILGNKYQDRPGWIVVSGMRFCGDKLLIASKRFHSLFALDWEKQTLSWVLAPESIWQDTPVEKYLLDGEKGQIMEDYLPEHFEAERDGEELVRLRLYCIQNKGSVPAENASASEDSRIAYYAVDEGKKTFRREKELDVVKSKRFGSSLSIDGNKNLLSLSGVLDRQSEDLRSCIEELHGETGDVINRLRLCKIFHQAWFFQPDIPAYSQPVPKKLDVIYGHLSAPSKYTGKIPDPCGEKLRKKIFGNIRVCGELFLFAFYPGTVEKVYLVGEKYCYMQDYSGLKLKRRKESFAIALDQLQKDEYQVYVDYDGDTYQLKNEIRIETGGQE